MGVWLIQLHMNNEIIQRTVDFGVIRSRVKLLKEKCFLPTKIDFLDFEQSHFHGCAFILICYAIEKEQETMS